MKLSKVTALLVVLALTLSIMLTACSPAAPAPAPAPEVPKAEAPAPSAQPDKEPEAPQPAAKIKVGIVLSTGGKGDKSFNDSCLVGLERAEKELGVETKYLEPKDVADNERSLEFLVKEKYDLIIAVGFMMIDSLLKVADKYPDAKFAGIDMSFGEECPKNVMAIGFREDEGSFLVGVLAAKMTKTNVVGFLGGMDSPLINRFEGGFWQGVELVEKLDGKTITHLSAYCGSDGGAFANPAKGKEIALNFASKKADIIYHASGNSGNGMFEAAVEKNFIAIGVDANQNYLKPGYIIASMLKRVDVGCFNAAKDVLNGTFKGGDVAMTLAVDGVGITDLKNLTVEETEGLSAEDQAKIKALKDTIPDDVRTLIDQCKADIASGKITIVDWAINKPAK